MNIPFFTALKKIRSLLGFSPRAPGEPPDVPNNEAREIGVDTIINQPNINTMSMFNYGVGGNEVKVDANEAIQEIQENKTLMVAKLTNYSPTKPEIVPDLRTIEDLFRYFRPSLQVEHETADGQSKKEDFNFKNLGDFTPAGIIQQSAYLKELNLQQEQYNMIIRQIRTNKVLRSVLENAESKQSFIQALKAVATELQNAQ